MERPEAALVWATISGRMRVHKEGGWVKQIEYLRMRDYALALESKLLQIEGKPDGN